MTRFRVASLGDLPQTPLQVIVLIAFCLFCSPLAAQDLQAENERRITTNTYAMGVLGGWSVANIGVGAAGWATAEEPWVESFHLMNAGWNLVNLTIASFGMYSALTEDPSNYDVWDTIDAADSIQTALLVNAALDIAYVAFGAYLAVRGDRDDDPQLVGFGRSIMLQGAFLFAFDLTVWGIHAIPHAEFREQLRGH